MKQKADKWTLRGMKVNDIDVRRLAMIQDRISWVSSSSYALMKILENSSIRMVFHKSLVECPEPIEMGRCNVREKIKLN